MGILLPFLGRTDKERRALINTIGPVWDGNEVWVLVAGGATFAAFPHWYATLFSGFYLALFLILVALIIRGVAFEYRSKRDNPGWRHGWDWAIFVGSVVPALLWGVAFANIVGGVPIDANKEFTGNLLTLLNPYGLLGGVVTLSLFVTHGAAYIALKTEGELRARANKTFLGAGLVAAVAAVAFLGWTQDPPALIPGSVGRLRPGGGGASSARSSPTGSSARAGRSSDRRPRSPWPWWRYSCTSTRTSCRPRPTRPSA